MLRHYIRLFAAQRAMGGHSAELPVVELRPVLWGLISIVTIRQDTLACTGQGGVRD